jgi:hypothetical protein
MRRRLHLIILCNAVNKKWILYCKAKDHLNAVHFAAGELANGSHYISVRFTKIQKNGPMYTSTRKVTKECLYNEGERS